MASLVETFTTSKFKVYVEVEGERRRTTSKLFILCCIQKEAPRGCCQCQPEDKGALAHSKHKKNNGRGVRHNTGSCEPMLCVRRL